MYRILATKMAISTAGEITQAVSMEGENAVVVDLTVFSGSISSVKVQGSNDLENWTPGDELITTGPITAGAWYLPATSGSYTGPLKDVATQYVRLLIDASSAAIIACGINTSSM